MNYKALFILTPIIAMSVIIANIQNSSGSTGGIVNNTNAVNIDALKEIITRESENFKVEVHQQTLKNLEDNLALAEISQLDGNSETAAIDRHVNHKQQKNQPWNTASTSAETPEFTLDASIKEYEVVNLNNLNENVRVNSGDSVFLLLPEDSEVEVYVVRSRANNTGGYTWQGYVTGYGDDYPVIYTQGSTSSFATITTPDGSYTMESVNGIGWIYKNPSIHELNTSGRGDQLEVANRF